jgi:hypothetical protein
MLSKPMLGWVGDSRPICDGSVSITPNGGDPMTSGSRLRRWLFAAVFLAGAPCALGWGLSRVVWVHPTKQESEFQRDYKDCQQKAVQNASNWGMKGNVLSIASDTNRCLLDMGWQKVKESELRAPLRLVASTYCCGGAKWSLLAANAMAVRPLGERLSQYLGHIRRCTAQ